MVRLDLPGSPLVEVQVVTGSEVNFRAGDTVDLVPDPQAVSFFKRGDVCGMSASSLASRAIANLQSVMFSTPSAKTYSHAGALLLLLPAALMLLTGFVYPLARLVALSMPDMSLELYIRIFRDPLYLNVLFSTTVVALAVMCCCLLLGFPVANAMVRLKHPGPSY